MISFPWDSVNLGLGDNGFPLYDRAYKAEQLREVLKVFFSDGVFMRPAASFPVRAADGMKVIVSPGNCHIQGDIGVERSEREMVFQAASSADRIDTVVLRWDINIDARSIDLYVKQGVASATPARPALTRNESVYELGICDVFIPANSTSITQQRITDTRSESARCGFVVPFEDIDTTTFYNQIQSAIDDRISYLESESSRIVNRLDSDSDRIVRELDAESAGQMRALRAETDRAVRLANQLVDETFAGEVLKRLETIAVEHTLYTTVDDSETAPISDSSGNEITGAVVFNTARKA